MTEQEFAFEKKLIISPSVYTESEGLLIAIERLLVYMEKTKKLNSISCQSFRLDYRQPSFDEVSSCPFGSMILEIKFGMFDMLEKTKKSNL